MDAGTTPVLVHNCGEDQYSHGGSVRYEGLDELGRPQGVHASIDKSMLDTGTGAGSRRPPGWRGNGTNFNEARGHLLANRLGGAGTGRLARYNLVTLNQTPVNSPWMRDLIEKPIYDAVDAGEIIQYSVKPIYEAGNTVPIRLEFAASGNKGFSLSGFLESPSARVLSGAFHF